MCTWLVPVLWLLSKQEQIVILAFFHTHINGADSHSHILHDQMLELDGLFVKSLPDLLTSFVSWYSLQIPRNEKSIINLKGSQLQFSKCKFGLLKKRFK